jgi:hypothetical protein
MQRYVFISYLYIDAAKGKNNTIMVLLILVCLLANSIQIAGAITDIVVEYPFYLRARILDSKTANVQFEIAEDNNQRTCEKYKFTIRHNHDYPYSMPEQNLTFWSNSLELKHLDFGDYRICAIICSEYLKQPHTYFNIFIKKNHSIPITTCVGFHAYRSHFLILVLYVLVFIILAFSQVIFTLHKRKFRATIKAGLNEVETMLQKWHSTQTASTSNEPGHSYTILQSLINLPASPLEHSAVTPPFHPVVDEHRPSHPVIFHLSTSNEHLT